MRHPEQPVAVIAHGSASTADFVRRAFAAPLAAAGYRLVTWDRRADPADAVATMAGLVRAHHARLVGGVSLGAMLAVRCAVDCVTDLDGVLLALPPWTGPPGEVAALSARTATDIERRGLGAVLDDVDATAVPWVAREVRRAWSAYDPDGLVAELRATAATPGPSARTLRACSVPAGVVALDGDPLHPVTVARAWAAALPRAVCRTLDIGAPGASVTALGASAVGAWQAARDAGRS